MVDYDQTPGEELDRDFFLLGGGGIEHLRKRAMRRMWAMRMLRAKKKSKTKRRDKAGDKDKERR